MSILTPEASQVQTNLADDLTDDLGPKPKPTLSPGRPVPAPPEPVTAGIIDTDRQPERQHFASTKRRPGTAGKNPKREIKVTTRETRPVHAFRAGMAKIIRYLPKRLQGPMFAHVICTDIKSGQHTYSLPTMAAYSAAIAPKYKLPVANVASLKRYNPRLADMGLVAREDRYGVYDAAGAGVQASRVSSLTKLDVEALKALMPKAIATESATYAATDAVTEGAPVSIPTVYAFIEAKASDRSPSVASSRPDDARDLPLKIKTLESAIQEIAPDFRFSWLMGGQLTMDRIRSWLDGQDDFSPERAEEFTRGLISSQKHVTAAILSKALSEASASEYDQFVRRGQLVIQAASRQAEEDRQRQIDAEAARQKKNYDQAHTWFAWHSNRPDYWFPGDDQRVRDERPPMDASNYQIWLSRSEHDRTGHNSLTSDQLGRIYGGPDFEKVRVYHRRRRFDRGRV